MSKIFRFIFGLLVLGGANLAQAKTLPTDCNFYFLDPKFHTQSVKRLLWEYHQERDSRSPISAEELRFKGFDSKDVYNPTAPFRINGEEIIAGRVESRNSETDTMVVFFRKAADGRWEQAPNSPTFKMQDPFTTTIGKERIIGGVETFHRPDGSLGYKTIFYKGTTLANMKKFAEGPVGMKDIRLQELENGKIFVFTRPQGGIAGRGKIGLVEINNLSELGPQKISEAALFVPQFANGEWGGVNETRLLSNGKIGILAHGARFDAKGGRHYYSATFAYDPKSKTFSPLKILFETKDLPKSDSKRPDLDDVEFSGGAIRNKDGTATVYIGKGDAKTLKVVIPDPFLEYESEP